MTKIDKLFRQNQVGCGGFEFNADVARVFDDMISRSVPLYDDVQRAIPRLVNMLEHQTIKVVDLGCSTGTSLIHLALALQNRNLELIGVDSSSAMLDQCRVKLDEYDVTGLVELVENDICEFEFQNASVVLMNYTMQFVPVDQRLELLTSLHGSIRPGGFLILSEKFSHQDVRMDQEMFELYRQYKRSNGYTEMEIARKRDALENVLVPYSVEENTRLLNSAGFREVELVLKWFNFGTFVAYA